MPLLLDSLFSSIALGHLMVDLLNGSRPVLLAFLSGPLSLTNANIALISTLYVWTASAGCQTASGHAGWPLAGFYG
jgi:hypothetical protein